jgi:hypothetical protein
MPDLTLEKRTELIDLWKHHEAIAMHFNDLISKIRIQALGGTAAIGAIAAAIGHASGGAFDYFLFGALGFLSVAWTALWQLDYGYYQLLLRGAVVAIMDLEKQLDTVKMSTKIEAAFPGRVHGHFWFYSLIQGALLGLLACVGHFHWNDQHPHWATILDVMLAAWLVVVVVVSLPARKKKPAAGAPPASARRAA